MEHVPVRICITAVKLFWHWTLLMVHVDKQAFQSPVCLSVCSTTLYSASPVRVVPVKNWEAGFRAER